MDDWIDDITQLIFNSSFMTLATADGEALPWASPVEFVCDETLRFYWASHADARHSRNLRSNPRAALSIYDSTQTPGVRGEAQGLYAEGPVEELHRADLEGVLPSLDRWTVWRDAGRAAPRPGSSVELFADGTPWRMYRLTPTRMFALNPAGHPDFPGVRVWRAPVDLTASFTRAYRSRLERQKSGPPG